MVGWYLALAASQQSSVHLLQFAPNSLECLDANHSFSFRLGLQTAAYSSFPCAGTIDLNTLPTWYVSSQGRPIHYVICTSYTHTHFAYLGTFLGTW